MTRLRLPCRFWWGRFFVCGPTRVIGNSWAPRPRRVSRATGLYLPRPSPRSTEPAKRFPPIRVAIPGAQRKSPDCIEALPMAARAQMGSSRIFTHVLSTVATMPSGTSSWSIEPGGVELADCVHETSDGTPRCWSAAAQRNQLPQPTQRQSNSTIQLALDHYFHNPSNRRPATRV